MNARIPTERLDRLRRESTLLTGLDLIRSAGIFGSAELHEVVKVIHESCKHKDEHTEQLSDLLIDLQGTVFYPPEPEVLEYRSERGEYGAGTPGVRGRAGNA
jgi:hypothetical protein